MLVKCFLKKVPVITRELYKVELSLTDSTLFLSEAVYP